MVGDLMEKEILMKKAKANVATKHKHLNDIDKFYLMTEPLRRHDGSLNDFLANDIMKFLGKNFAKLDQKIATEFVLGVDRRETSLKFWENLLQRYAASATS